MRPFLKPHRLYGWQKCVWTFTHACTGTHSHTHTNIHIHACIAHERRERHVSNGFSFFTTTHQVPTASLRGSRRRSNAVPHQQAPCQHQGAGWAPVTLKQAPQTLVGLYLHTGARTSRQTNSRCGRNIRKHHIKACFYCSLVVARLHPTESSPDAQFRTPEDSRAHYCLPVHLPAWLRGAVLLPNSWRADCRHEG